MKKLITILFLLVFTVTTFAMATAYWTGKSRYGVSVTGQSMVSCEYNYAGNKFWRGFVGSVCPTSVTVY